MSIDSLQEIDIISNIQDEAESFSTTDLFSYLPKQTIIWINNSNFLFDNQENIGLGKLRQTIQNHHSKC